MDSNVAASLKSSNIDPAIISRRMSQFIQVPDVSWNKSFKAMYIERYDQWLVKERIHNKTAEGNLKVPPRKRIVEWILKS